ncbi:MAG: chemotaxis protein CheB [Desulfobacteraceae bacterium]|jgi:two-component system chemotaxis response regulator CheB
MGTRIKVLVVDDSLFMRNAISEIVESDPQLKVVGTAKDGADGLRKVKALQPDVVILDIDMPGMNGLSAIRNLMIRYPVPILVFSSLFSYGEVTFEALELGVIDFLPKPSGMVAGRMGDIRKQITDRVKVASGADIGNVRRVKLTPQHRQPKSYFQAVAAPLDNIIAVGAGFGGTNSVIRLLSQLSTGMPCAVIALIEMSPEILPSFAAKFNASVPWDVRPVEDGQTIRPGRCYIGSTETTVRVDRDKQYAPCLRLYEKSMNPLNELFRSTVQVFNLNTIGVLMTGLGADGADGFSRIQVQNGVTIVPDTVCSVRPNFTQSAIDFGTVTHIVSEGRLADVIEKAIAVRVEYKVA